MKNITECKALYAKHIEKEKALCENASRELADRIAEECAKAAKYGIESVEWEVCEADAYYHARAITFLRRQGFIISIDETYKLPRLTIQGWAE